MKEYQRQIAVEQISEELGEKGLLIAKYQQLENLKKDPKVAEYFALLEEIEKIEKKYSYRETEDDIICSVFERLMDSEFKCNHEIWLYDGSYYLLIDYIRHEHDSLCRKDSEELPTRKGEFEFEYNEYICLECGKKLEVKDWKNFERNHFVLKNQNDIQNLDVEKYISLYYRSLYKMSVEKAKNIVIKEFDKEKKAKARVLSK